MAEMVKIIAGTRSLAADHFARFAQSAVPEYRLDLNGPLVKAGFRRAIIACPGAPRQFPKQPNPRPGPSAP
jgi:hypothetical protein